jgi:hypothetical protein
LLKLGKNKEKNMLLTLNFKKISLGLCLGFLALLPIAGLAATDQTMQTGSVYLPAEAVYDNPFWTAGQSVILNSQMKDDVYLAGANVVVSGPIDGDLIVAGSNIIINSEIKGDLRVVGGMITINGKISGNVTALGGMITISKDAQISKSLVVLGGNVEMNGKIGRNLYAATGNLLVNNEIKGNVYASVDGEGGLALLPSASILGRLEYTASEPANIYDGAKVNEEKFTELIVKPAEPVRKNSGLVLTFWLIGLLSSIVVGLVVVFLLKDLAVKIKNQLSVKVPLTILKGLIYLIVTPIALLILAVTIIGAPLAVILGVLYGITLYLCQIFIGIFIGDWVLQKIFKSGTSQLVWSMMIGLLIIYALALIPLVGLLVKLAIVLWGLGAVMAVVKKELNLENN